MEIRDKNIVDDRERNQVNIFWREYTFCIAFLYIVYIIFKCSMVLCRKQT